MSSPIVRYFLLFLLVFPASWAQAAWSLYDAGVGILDESFTPPRVVERDRPVWGTDDIAAKLGGRRYFSFWVVGPRPELHRNRFGIPIYNFRWQATRQGDAPRGSLTSFSSEGWGGYQLDIRPGSYQVDVFLVNRDTQEEQPIKTLYYQVVLGTAGGAQPVHPTGERPPYPGLDSRPGRPDQDPYSTRPGRGPEVFLSDLSEAASGNVHGGLGKDRPYWQQELSIGGRSFSKGLVTHPGASGERAWVEYALGGQYRRFLATLGAAADHGNYGQASMNYYIVVDGRVVEQGRFPSPPNTREISVSVQGAQTLRLEVDNGGDGNHSDHAAWGNARLRR